MSEALIDRQQRILQRVAAGEGWREAAKKEGCSDSYSRVIRTRMKKNPIVAKALEEIRQKGCAMAVYDLAVAMKEAEEVIAFAKAHKHPTAYFFAVRHRAHLSGLLIDRVEIATVDLTGALARAEARVLSGTPPTIPAQASTYYDPPASMQSTQAVAIDANQPSAPLPSSRRPIDWRPRIPGNPDTGSADGQATS